MILLLEDLSLVPFQEFETIIPQDAYHLGSVDAYLKEKIELLHLMGDRSEHLQSHDVIT